MSPFTMSAGAALAASRRAEMTGRIRRVGVADLYTWALILAIGFGLLAGVHLPTADAASLHLVRVTVPVFGAVILGSAWVLYLTRRRSVTTPFRFSVAEVSFLLMAPVARTDLYRQLARRRSVRISLAVLGGAVALGILNSQLLHGHGPLGFLGPLGALASLAGGWVWSTYSQHSPGPARAASVAVGGLSALLGLVQPGLGLPLVVNPLRMVLVLASGSGLAQPAALIIALTLLVLGATALGLATVWVPAVPIEPIVRRAPIVSQLRFALARGDTRAASLLFRKSAGDEPRTTPWLAWRPSWRGDAGAAALAVAATWARTPAGRLARAGLLIGAQVLVVATALSHQEVVAAGVGAGLVGYLLGLGLLEATAELLDTTEPLRTTPARPRRLMAVQAGLALLVATTVAMAVCAGTGPALAMVLAVPVGLAAVIGPLMSLVLGPPSIDFVVQAGLTNPLVAPVLIAGRYLLGVLVTIGLTGAALLLWTWHPVWLLAVVATETGVGTWTLRRVPRA